MIINVERKMADKNSLLRDHHRYIRFYGKVLPVLAGPFSKAPRSAAEDGFRLSTVNSVTHSPWSAKISTESPASFQVWVHGNQDGWSPYSQDSSYSPFPLSPEVRYYQKVSSLNRLSRAKTLLSATALIQRCSSYYYQWINSVCPGKNCPSFSNVPHPLAHQ